LGLGRRAHIPLGDPNDANLAYAPPLAQFALREAKVLARNILAHLEGRPLTAFEHRSLGTMAALGGRRGVADIMGVRVSGFLAWVAPRTGCSISWSAAAPQRFAPRNRPAARFASSRVTW
jgi:NADH dehydrogenase